MPKRKRKMSSTKSHVNNDGPIDRWKDYTPIRVLADDRIDENKIDMQFQRKVDREMSKKHQYFISNELIDKYVSCDSYEKWKSESEKLSNWIRDNSWSACKDCGILTENKMIPSMSAVNKSKTECPCAGNKYTVPRKEDFPHAGLYTKDDQKVLAIFEIDVGNERRSPTGYRPRVKPFTLYVNKTVDDKISEISDPERKERLQKKFESLKQDNIHYAYFYERASVKLCNEENNIPYYEVFQMEYIEIALWPLLYVKEEFCESSMKGSEDRQSAKHAFHLKCTSTIVDFSQDYEMLQFHFDRWLYKTVCGAVESGKKFKCSARQSLETKSFSSSKWEYEHLFLIDATRQFGDPSIFLTISVAEWKFPKCTWLDKRARMTSANFQNIAYDITIHILHVLEQYARGYISGGNDVKWKRHLTADLKNPKRQNVDMYFYRFEYQERGTPHLHMLLWIKHLQYTDIKRFSAHAPEDNPELNYAVKTIQKSDKEGKFPISEKTICPSKYLFSMHLRDSFIAQQLKSSLATLHYIFVIIECIYPFYIC